jgi:hypothetical protein
MYSNDVKSSILLLENVDLSIFKKSTEQLWTRQVATICLPSTAIDTSPSTVEIDQLPRERGYIVRSTAPLAFRK